MPKSGIARYRVPASWGTAHQFPQWLCKFVLLPALDECFLYSISLHAWAIICFIDLGSSDPCILLFPFCNLLFCLNDGILCNVEAFQSYEIPFILLFFLNAFAIGVLFRKSFPGSMHSGLLPTFTEDPDTCLHTYRQLSFDKETTSTHWQTASSKNSAG